MAKTEFVEDILINKPKIQTPQDALMAYLHGLLDTDEDLAEVLGLYGVTPDSLAQFVKTGPGTRLDDGFEKKIPDDLLGPVLSPEDTFEVHKKMVQEKKAIRTEASKAAEKDKSREETIKRESNPDFQNNLEKKHITDPLSDAVSFKKG